MCARARVRVCLCMCIPLYSPTQPLLLFCLVSFSSSHSHCRKQTLALCPPLDLPSVQGDQVGGKMLCRNARPLPEARLLFHLIIEQKLHFVSLPWSQTKHPVLSSFFLPFFTESTWDGNRGSVFRDCQLLDTHGLV